MSYRHIQEIKAPNTLYSIDAFIRKKIFLAGGVTGNYDWRKVLLNTIDSHLGAYVRGGDDLIAFDPVRKDFDASNEKLIEELVCWEFEHLAKADVTVFWFIEETLCPMTLYELGYALASGREVVIGIHPKYAKRNDVVIQSTVAGYKGSYSNSLDFLAKNVIKKLYK